MAMMSEQYFAETFGQRFRLIAESSINVPQLAGTSCCSVSRRSQRAGQKLLSACRIAGSQHPAFSQRNRGSIPAYASALQYRMATRRLAGKLLRKGQPCCGSEEWGGSAPETRPTYWILSATLLRVLSPLGGQVPLLTLLMQSRRTSGLNQSRRRRKRKKVSKETGT